MKTALIALTRGPARAGWFARARRRILLWIEVTNGRRLLARLDDRQLRDIGIDRETAQREARRPFWDI